MRLTHNNFSIKKRCLKKYCQCFIQGRYCTESCTCQSCHNKPGLRFRGEEESSSSQGRSRLWIDDASTDSSTRSNNVNALDALMESQTTSSLTKKKMDESSLVHSIPKKRKLKEPEGYKDHLPMPSVPPPNIPDVFKSTVSSMSIINSVPPPPEIPEVFLNATSTGSVPPDVFTNPNFWLQSNNIRGDTLQWGTSLTTSISHKKNSSMKRWSK